MTGQHVGYIRVSSIGQNTARQLDGIHLDEVFEDKASGKDRSRPALESCLRHVRKGDVLHIHSIDRLCRNLTHCLEIIEELAEKGVAVHFVKESLTFSGASDPMGKLMLQMMGAFAEFERSLIHERQAEGIAKAKVAGKYKGRKKALSAGQVAEIKARASKGEGKAALAREYGVSRQTLYAALEDR